MLKIIDFEKIEKEVFSMGDVKIFSDILIKDVVKLILNEDEDLIKCFENLENDCSALSTLYYIKVVSNPKAISFIKQLISYYDFEKLEASKEYKIILEEAKIFIKGLLIRFIADKLEQDGYEVELED